MLSGHLDLVHSRLTVIIDIAPTATADLLFTVKPITYLTNLVKDLMSFFIRSFRPASRYPFHHGLGVGYDASWQIRGFWSQLSRIRAMETLFALFVCDFLREINRSRIGATSL
jgi:hypothetical protein